MDADVMSLEEVENSTKIGDANRDDALIRLVEQLNLHWANAHPTYPGDRWAYVPSPRTEAQPTLQEQDAIRSAFIYNPSKVETVGRSRILVNSAPFRNAREPLAQAFKPAGSGRANAFGVVVNHFKSKGGPTAPATVNGDNVDAGDGAGFYNGDRKRQAAALVAFSDQFAADKNIEAMFLTGDFNAYAMEDPVQVIKDAGYHDCTRRTVRRPTASGVWPARRPRLRERPAHEMVTGDRRVVDQRERAGVLRVQPIQLQPDRPVRRQRVPQLRPQPGDHRDQLGRDRPRQRRGDRPGPGHERLPRRILDDPAAQPLVRPRSRERSRSLRAEDEDTVFAAAGDLVGASTFESFVAERQAHHRRPQRGRPRGVRCGQPRVRPGLRDLVDRVMVPKRRDQPRGWGSWQYIARQRPRQEHRGRSHGRRGRAAGDLVPQSSPDGKTVGFVGAVTEDLPALVAGDGISEIEVTDIVDWSTTQCRRAQGSRRLRRPEGCDLVVMLVHEGAATTSNSAVTDGSTFADIVSGADENIDAIVSGHTHLAYNYKVPVQEWIDEGRAVTKRPVVSAGQYGANLNSLEFEYLPGTEQAVKHPPDGARAEGLRRRPGDPGHRRRRGRCSAEVGNRPLGEIEGPFQRARRNDPVAQSVAENRGGESTLGNLVAEIQRWKTDADIAFMNPGGLRADMLGAVRETVAS